MRVADFAAIASLIHLRELCADDNAIMDISGVFCLNGLLKLSLRNNCITGLDFSNGCTLARLEEMDLSNNKLSFFNACDRLHSLITLDLGIE